MNGINNDMSLESNSGSEYYGIPIGVKSLSPNLSSNIGTSYYWLSCNDYILWGQDLFYPHSSSNSVLSYHFLQCNVPSDGNLVLSANNGTKYYYSSSFNCVPFEGNQSVWYNGLTILYNGETIIYN